MRLGILVEGESDRVSVPHLITKVTPGTPVVARRTRGSGPLLDAHKIRGYVTELREKGVQRIVILRDCECTDPREYREAAQRVINTLSRVFPGLPAQEGVGKDLRFQVRLHA